MFCPKCAKENPDRNKFCNRCGASLQIEFVKPPLIAPPPPKQSPTAPPEVSVPTDILLRVEPEEISVEEFTAQKSIEEIFPAEKPTESAIVESPVIIPADKIDEGKQHGDLLKVFEDTESRLDEILVEEKEITERQQLLIQETSSTDKPITAPPASSEIPNTNNLDDYRSEIESKYRASQNRNQTDKKNRLIFGAAATAGVILLGGLVGFGWYLIKSSRPPAETVAENQTPVVEKINTNQPPPDMVYVPGGEFLMGSDTGDEYERPAHRVSVKPFFIDKTEVTCEEYKKFVDATGHAAPSIWQNNTFPVGSARKPVTGVNWDDANAFAKWKNKRLPTEEEWEFAARGTDGRIYPWGNEWKPQMANAGNQKNTFQDVSLTGGQSPFGVFDMVGNAWEWTSSDADAYPNGKSFSTKSTDAKIIRGGFFGSPKEKATTTFRRGWGSRSENDYKNTSFRCISSIRSNQGANQDF